MDLEVVALHGFCEASESQRIVWFLVGNGGTDYGDYRGLGFGVYGLWRLIWEFPIFRGPLFCGPDNKDPTIWGTILGSPIFGNPHIGAYIGATIGIHSPISCWHQTEDGALSCDRERLDGGGGGGERVLKGPWNLGTRVFRKVTSLIISHNPK